MRVRRSSGSGSGWVVSLAAILLVSGMCAHASVALLLEESYGTFGALSPTGHAAVYLDHVCAASPTELRACGPGEYGVVISRYHKINGYDWFAMPLIPYLYAVDEAGDIPSFVNKAQVTELRNDYRRQYLVGLAPDKKNGNPPGGAWIQLVGSSYDRAIHGFQVATTAEQDARFIGTMNDSRNVSHFNLLFHNCADFSRMVLNIYLPHAIHRNFIGDIGFTTPKQVAKSLAAYARKHPEVEMSAFVIPQVPGSMKRSHPANGVMESLVKSKKYLLPLAVLSPQLAGGMAVAYFAEERGKLPKPTTVFRVADVEIGAGARTEKHVGSTAAASPNL